MELHWSSLYILVNEEKKLTDLFRSDLGKLTLRIDC
jgi:hypothetical protein